MPFSPVSYSQQDPAWKSLKIGSSDEAIGHVGCALTSVAMLLSGHGYPETPETLNAGLKTRGGYVDASIIWGAVTSLYPQVVYRSLVLCRDTNAPLAQIDTYLAAGQPVLAEVDNSPNPGLQTHWVVLYKKQGEDYLMLDPWPYPAESGKEVPLMPRYSHGKPLRKSITAVVFYECLQQGSGAASDTAGTEPASPAGPGSYVRVPVTVEAGLRLRSAPTTASSVVTVEPPGALLRVTEPVEVALPKIGVYDQWIKVRDGQGRDGYVAAWYVERGPVVAGEAGPTPAEPGPGPSEPATPAPVPAALTVYVLQSVGSSGLRLRQTPSLGGVLVAVEPAGTALTLLEPEAQARPKIGVIGEWLHVSDPERRQGYVAAEFVELETEPTTEEPGPITEEVTIYVSGAAAAGLRLRSAPTTNASTLKILAPNTPLTLLQGTLDLIGAYNIWLKVREPEGMEGFVAAWYVRK